MKVKCIDNNGQKNRLTVDKYYNAKHYTLSLYTILDNENNECNFLIERFNIINIKKRKKIKT